MNNAIMDLGKKASSQQNWFVVEKQELSFIFTNKSVFMANDRKNNVLGTRDRNWIFYEENLELIKIVQSSGHGILFGYSREPCWN